MNLQSTLEIYGGGPGSGCKGPNCGRPVKEITKVATKSSLLKLHNRLYMPDDQYKKDEFGNLTKNIHTLSQMKRRFESRGNGLLELHKQLSDMPSTNKDLLVRARKYMELADGLYHGENDIDRAIAFQEMALSTLHTAIEEMFPTVKG